MWSNLISNTLAPREDYYQDNDDDEGPQEHILEEDIGDGWEDDDEEGVVDRMTPIQQNENPRPLTPPPGGGLRIMGRLTRFLEQVTQPEERYEEDGWEDDHDIDLDDGTETQEEPQLATMTMEQPAPPQPHQPIRLASAELRDKEDQQIAENAWHEETLHLDDDDDEVNVSNDDSAYYNNNPLVPTGMRESIHQAQEVLDQALEDLPAAAPNTGAVSVATSDNDLHEDAVQEQQAIYEIQREMQDLQQRSRPMVDATPSERQGRTNGGDTSALHRIRSAATSLQTQWTTEDGTRDSGPVAGMSQQDDDEEVFRDENEEEYGPVVDHVPRSSRRTRGRRRSDRNSPADALTDASIIPQFRDDEEDATMDDLDTAAALDETIATNDEDVIITEQGQSVSLLSSPPVVVPAVVDHTPSIAAYSRRGAAGSDSVNAILSIAGETNRTLIIGEDEEDEPADYGPVVDQIPHEPSTAPVSGSVMPVVADDLSQEFVTDEAMDETVFFPKQTEDTSTIDGTATLENGWAEDDDVDILDDGEGPSSAAVTNKVDTRLASGAREPVVDHTPLDDGETKATSDPSIRVLAMEEDLTRDTGEPLDDEVFGEENELDFAPVVDHTPLDTASSRRASTDASLQVEASALEDDFREDDAMDETCFGDSVAEPNVEKVEGGWEGEIRAPADASNPNMVDQTPSQLGSPPAKYADPSIAVLASIDESVDEEGSEYGLVVDQTPLTPAAPSTNRSDSVIVQAADMETVEDETLNDDEEGSNDNEEEGGDGDTFGDEMPLGIGAAIRNAEGTLVDRVPVRPESRFGDASTMVAADPSEIMSEVDDLMAQEMEQNFGPVVDVTPLGESVSGRPSATGSTVAFAPNSVATDDLEEDDDGEETEGNDVWNSTILEEATPNPQSGNDEPVQQQEQVVDFLPEEDTSSHHPEDVSVMGRTVSSSVAIGGAQSLLQAEDPKEDDFGPVVDLTPAPLSILPTSAASTATNVTASEMRSLEKEDNLEGRSVDFDLDEKSNVVVDHIPDIRSRQILDSLATVAQSQLTEEEEEETASKFGPVVDHLPTPRTSIAPSRGGSTVDALATVSEADSAGQEGSGWDDDLDIEDASAESDRTDRISTLGSVRRAQSTASDHDRSVSVRFDSTVRSVTLKPPPPVTSKNLYPPSQDSSTTDGWEDDDIATDAADAPSSVAAGILAKQVDSNMANAETPPAAPYHRSITRHGVIEESLLQPTMTDCSGCSNQRECTYIQKLLRVNRKAGALIGTLITEGGDSLEVDFGEMLREEIAKRRLVEEEAAALRVVAAKQRDRADNPNDKEKIDEGESHRLREENERLFRKVADLQGEGDLLRENGRNLSEELNRSLVSLEELRKTKNDLTYRENMHVAEIARLKNLVSQSENNLSAEDEAVNSMVNLEKALFEKDSRCKRLEAELSSLISQMAETDAAMNMASTQSSEELAMYQKKVSDTESELAQAQALAIEANQALEKANHKADSQALAAASELESLREARRISEERVQDLTQQLEVERKQHSNELNARASQLKALEAKLLASEQAKSKQLTEAETNLSRSEGRYADLMNRLSTVASERDALQASLSDTRETAASLQRTLDEQGLKKEEIESRRAVETTALREDMKALRSELQSKTRSTEELSRKIREVVIEKDNAIADAEAAQSSVWDLQEQLETSNAVLADAESRAETLEKSVAQAETQLERARVDLERAHNERLHLESRAKELERKLETLSANSSQQVSRAVELEAQLEERRVHADQAVVQRDQEIGRLHEELNKLSVKSNDQQHLEVELQNAREWVGLLQQEKESLSEENEELLVQLGLLKGQADEAAATILSFQQEMDCLLMALDSVNNGGDFNLNGFEISQASQSVIDTLFGLQTRYAELEAEMANFASDHERELEKQVVHLSDKCQSLNAELAELRASNTSTSSVDRAQLHELELQVKSLQHACQEKDHVLQAKSFELSQLMSQQQALQVQLKLAQTSSDDIDNGQVEMLRHVEQAETALLQARTELDESRAMVNDLQEQLASREAYLEEMQTSQESTSQAMASDILHWQNRAQELEQEFANQAAHVAELERKLEDLKQVGSFEGFGDDVESLQVQIVSLANALEKSELQRADAMDHLVEERRANAESLRRLGESVQRFYSNVKSITS